MLGDTINALQRRAVGALLPAVVLAVATGCAQGGDVEVFCAKVEEFAPTLINQVAILRAYEADQFDQLPVSVFDDSVRTIQLQWTDLDSAAPLEIKTEVQEIAKHWNAQNPSTTDALDRATILFVRSAEWKTFVDFAVSTCNMSLTE